MTNHIKLSLTVRPIIGDYQNTPIKLVVLLFNGWELVAMAETETVNS